MSVRNLLWQVPIALLLLFPVWQGWVVNFLTLEIKRPTTQVKSEASLSLEGVVLTQSQNGKDEIILNADRLYSLNDQKIFELENADAQLMGSGEKPIKVRSGSASYDTGKQIMTLLDNVEVVTADNYLLNTEAMRYLAKFKVLKSAADVELTGEQMAITGTSFSYALNSGDFRVGGRVRCELW